MTTKSKSANVTNLLAAIQRKAPDSPINDPPSNPETVTHPKPRRQPSRRSAAAPLPKSNRGTPAQFWFHDEDRRLVRELAAWLAGQGVRSTDSLVIRAALRATKTGQEFLDAYHHASRLDGRLKSHKDQTHEST